MSLFDELDAQTVEPDYDDAGAAVSLHALAGAGVPAARGRLPVSTYVLGLCPGSLGTAWPVARWLAQPETHRTLSSLGRLRP